MAGPWEKYKSDAPSQAEGPWNNYQLKARPAVEAEPDKTPMLPAMIDKLGNGFSAGYLPQIKAGLESLLPDEEARAYVNAPIENLFDPKWRSEADKLSGQKKSYTEIRDEMSRKLNQHSEEHPVASGVGEVGGAVLGGIASGGAKLAAKGASLLGKLGYGARAGGIYGLVANPGDVEGEISPIQLGDRVMNAGKGALAGVLSTGALEGAARGLKAGSSALARKAEEKAFKSAGANLRDFRNANDRGTVNKVGRQLLDEKVVTPFASPKDIIERSERGMTNHGERIEKLLGDLEAAGAKLPQGAKAGIDRKGIAQAMKKDLLSGSSEIPGSAAKNTRLESLINEFESGGDDLIGVLKGEQLKRAVGKEVNWKRLPGADIPIEEQVQRSLYTNLKRGVEDSADGLEKLVGGPGSKSFIESKNAYGALETAKKMAEDKVSRDSARRAFGLTDTISGGAAGAVGMAMGGPAGAAVGGALGAGANKFARTYGDTLMATGADKASKYAGLLSKYAQATGKNPGMTGIMGAKGAVDSYSRKPEARPEDNEKLIEMLTRNPELIEEFKDDDLKERLKKKMGREPSLVPIEQAQDEFLKGN